MKLLCRRIVACFTAFATCWICCMSTGTMMPSFASTIPTNQTDETLRFYADQVVALINIEREQNGLQPVYASEELYAAAATRAEELTQSFSHTRPNGSSFYTILEEKAISFSQCGENIATGYQSPEEVVEGWMNSTGHRENILNANYEYLGVGVANDGSICWTQLFTAGSNLTNIYLPTYQEPSSTVTTTNTTTTTAFTTTATDTEMSSDFLTLNYTFHTGDKLHFTLKGTPNRTATVTYEGFNANYERITGIDVIEFDSDGLSENVWEFEEGTTISTITATCTTGASITFTECYIEEDSESTTTTTTNTTTTTTAETVSTTTTTENAELIDTVSVYQSISTNDTLSISFYGTPYADATVFLYCTDSNGDDFTYYSHITLDENGTYTSHWKFTENFYLNYLETISTVQQHVAFQGYTITQAETTTVTTLVTTTTTTITTTTTTAVATTTSDPNSTYDLVITPKSLQLTLSELKACNYQLEIPIYFTKNNGFRFLSFGYALDNRLQYVDFTRNTSSLVISQSHNDEAFFGWIGCIFMNTASAENCYTDTALCTLTLTIPENAQAGDTYEISLSDTSLAGNEASAEGNDGNPLQMRLENGSITILEDPLYGDVNLDGMLSLEDVVLMNRALAGTLTLPSTSMELADCYGADDIFNTSDCTALLKLLVHLIPSLPELPKA